VDINEWLAAQWAYWRRKVDQLIIGGLAILLAIVAGLWWLEQQVPGLPPVPTPPPPPEYTPGEWTWTKSLFTHEKSVRDVSSFRSELSQNMFDVRGVTARPLPQVQLDEKYLAAKDAFAKGDMAEATRLCNEILSQSPTHQGAAELLKLIKK